MKKLLIHCKRCAVLLLALTAVSLNSCTDYDDDISDLQSQIDKNSDDIETNAGNIASNAALIAANSSTISSLQTDLAALTSTVGALQLGDQVEVTTDGKDMTVTVNGVDYTIYGTVCETPTLSISETTGNWVLSGEDTGYPAITSLVEPTLTVVDGNWYLNGNDTGYPAVLEDTNTTENSTLEISEDGTWVLDGVDTGFPAITVDTNTTIKSTLEVVDGYWYIDGENTGITAVTEIVDPVLSIIDGKWAINGVATEYTAITEDNDTVCDCVGLVVGPNGNWFINGVDTTYPSVYEESTKMEAIDGYWYIDGEKTDVLAITEDVLESGYAQTWSTFVSEEDGLSYWQYEVNGKTYETTIPVVVDTDTDTDTDTTYEYNFVTEEGQVYLVVTATTTDEAGETVVTTGDPIATGASSNVVSALLSDDSNSFKLSVDGVEYDFDLTSTVPLKTLAFIPDAIESGMGTFSVYTIYGYANDLGTYYDLDGDKKVDDLYDRDGFRGTTSTLGYIGDYYKDASVGYGYLGTDISAIDYRTSCDISASDYEWEFLTRDVTMTRAEGDEEGLVNIHQIEEVDSDEVSFYVSFSSSFSVVAGTTAATASTKKAVYSGFIFAEKSTDTYVSGAVQTSYADTSASDKEDILALSATPVVNDYTEDIVSDYQTVFATPLYDFAIFNTEDKDGTNYKNSAYPDWLTYAETDDKTTTTDDWNYYTYNGATPIATTGNNYSATAYRVQLGLNDKLNLLDIVSVWSCSYNYESEVELVGISDIAKAGDANVAVLQDEIVYTFSIDAESSYFADSKVTGDDKVTLQNSFVELSADGVLTAVKSAYDETTGNNAAIGREPVVYVKASYGDADDALILAEAFIPIVIVDEVNNDPEAPLYSYTLADAIEYNYRDLEENNRADYVSYDDVMTWVMMNAIYDELGSGKYTDEDGNTSEYTPNSTFSQELFEDNYSVSAIKSTTTIAQTPVSPAKYAIGDFFAEDFGPQAILGESIATVNGYDGYTYRSFAYDKIIDEQETPVYGLVDYRGITVAANITPNAGVTGTQTAAVVINANDHALLGTYSFAVEFKLNEGKYSTKDLPATITINFTVKISETAPVLPAEYPQVLTLTDEDGNEYEQMETWGKYVETSATTGQYKMQLKISSVFEDDLASFTFPYNVDEKDVVNGDETNYKALGFLITDNVYDVTYDADGKVVSSVAKFEIFNTDNSYVRWPFTEAILKNDSKSGQNSYETQEIGLVAGQYMDADEYTVGITAAYYLKNGEVIYGDDYNVLFKNPLVLDCDDVLLDHLTTVGSIDYAPLTVKINTVMTSVDGYNATSMPSQTIFGYYNAGDAIPDASGKFSYDRYYFTDVTYKTVDVFNYVYNFTATDYTFDQNIGGVDYYYNSDSSNTDFVISVGDTFTALPYDNGKYPSFGDGRLSATEIGASGDNCQYAVIGWTCDGSSYPLDMVATIPVTVIVGGEFQLTEAAKIIVQSNN